MTTTTALGQRVTSLYPHRDVPTYVYRCYDETGRLLYVGCTYNPPLRMHQHGKQSAWWPEVARVRLVVFPDRAYALARERDAIQNEEPLHNRPSRVVTLRRLAVKRGGAA